MFLKKRGFLSRSVELIGASRLTGYLGRQKQRLGIRIFQIFTRV